MEMQLHCITKWEHGSHHFHYVNQCFDQAKHSTDKIRYESGLKRFHFAAGE
jgi:hypothetical protein